MLHNNENYLVADCLDSLGMKALAREAYSTQNGEVLKSLAVVARNTAIKHNNTEVCERLQFAGFVY